MTKATELSKNEQKILKLFYSQAPNAIHLDLLKSRSSLSEDDIGEVLKSLMDKDIITTRLSDTNIDQLIQSITRNRISYLIKNYPNGFPFKEYIKIGNEKVPRLLDGDGVRAEDINIIIEAIVQYTNQLDQKISERIQKESSKIYRQMIGIFGVFVSIFAIIVISTDKMIHFNADILKEDWVNLFFKSSALFLPVGIIIFLLTVLVMWKSRK